MTNSRPTFRITKNGYDRFAVDDAIERYAAEIAQLERKLQLSQDQLVETTRNLEELRRRYQELQNTEDARPAPAANIARLSLREANEIINTAQKNADVIIREALASARGILEDLSVLYQEAGSVKTEASQKLENLLKDLDDFTLPEMPDLMWLKEAQDKLR